ncbi:hypothetical protein [Ramlibacter sp.]|uniref:hypothetical protein n=1 Tax=Ramlibacter sp. TaxID=1917967 RepID=UPI003D1192C7
MTGDKVETRTTESRAPGGFGSVAVAFGLDAMASPAAAHFSTLGYDDVSIATLLLAHETFHCSEWARARECGARFEVLGSGFAQGMEPGMSQPWRDLANLLAATYPSRQVMVPEVARAADIVSELRADVRCLDAARALGLGWPEVASDLLALRSDDEARSGADAYLISEAMREVVAAQLGEMDAIPLLWARAADILRTMRHGDEVDEALSAVAGQPFHAKQPKPRM